MRAPHWGNDTRALVLGLLKGFDASTFLHCAAQKFPAHLIQVVPIEVSRSKVILNLRQAFFKDGKAASTIKGPHQGEKIANCVLTVNSLWIRLLSVLTGYAFSETIKGRGEGPAKRNENGVDCA
jgi:hypothetical protein